VLDLFGDYVMLNSRKESQVHRFKFI